MATDKGLAYVRLLAQIKAKKVEPKSPRVRTRLTELQKSVAKEVVKHKIENLTNNLDDAKENRAYFKKEAAQLQRRVVEAENEVKTYTKVLSETKVELRAMTPAQILAQKHPDYCWCCKCEAVREIEREAERVANRQRKGGRWGKTMKRGKCKTKSVKGGWRGCRKGRAMKTWG